MNNFSFKIKEEELSQSASVVLQKFNKRYRIINLNKYLTWCITRNVDPRISSEVILKYLEINDTKNLKYYEIIDELKEKLIEVLIKKRLSNKDQHNAYDIMTDIVIILEKRDKLNKDQSYNMLKLIKAFILWIKNKAKIQ